MPEESEITALDKKLIRQVEFYFSDFNLHRDKFMQDQMKKNDGWFSMDTMLKFQRLSSVCSEPGTILAALKKSSNNLMDVDVENQQIRRKPNKPVPENDDKYRRELKKRSVYIKGFPQTETIEDITDFLEEDYGKIDGIQLRRFNNPHKGYAFKGSLFATFSKLEDASKFLDAPMVFYKDQQLEKMSKEQFWKEKEAENAEKGIKKTKRKSNTGTSEETEDHEEEEFGWIHVANLTDETITHVDIKGLLKEVGVDECRFFSRYEKNGPSGYILFGTKSEADTALSLLKEKKDNLTFSIKSSEQVAFSDITEEQEKLALNCYCDFRSFSKKNKKGKKFGGRNDRKRQGNKHIKFDDSNGSEPAAKQAKLEEA